MSLTSILNPLSETRIHRSKDFTDRTRGLHLPDELRFSPSGFDTGRPEFINAGSVSDYYSNDILAADRLFLPVENRTVERGGKPLFPFQRLFMREADEKQFLWLQMMRGGSKTYLLARFALDYALMHPNTPVVITAPSFRQALMCFDYVVQMIESNAKNENWPVNVGAQVVGEIKRNALESVVRLSNGSKILALPMGDGSKIRGVRGGVLIIDEFYQITEEMYESHILPFVQVRQGNRESKVIHATTSWYQDCFAYRRLMQIASEVRAGNPAYGILDFNLQDLVKCKFPLSETVWRDAMRHGNKLTRAMTYYNLWPSTEARFFEQKFIDEAMSAKHGIRVEMKPNLEPGQKYFAMFDLAASEHGDATEAVVYKYDDTDDSIAAVWARRFEKENKLGPTERAWLAHQVNDHWRTDFIVYDAHGAIGTDFRSELAKHELLVKGEVKKVRPLVHHDAYGLSGEYKLIPISVNDKAVKNALVGPNDGTTIHGEAGLKDLMMTKARDLLEEGRIRGPFTASEGDEDVAPDYSGTEIEVLDEIREAFNQLGHIRLKKDKNKNVMRSKDGTQLYETQAGKHDDGAYCILGGAIGLLHIVGDGTLKERVKPRNTTMSIREQKLRDNPANYIPEENVQKLRFA